MKVAVGLPDQQPQRKIMCHFQNAMEIVELNSPEVVTSIQPEITSPEQNNANGFKSGNNHISFHDITYEVTERGYNCKRKPNKVILNSVR